MGGGGRGSRRVRGARLPDRLRLPSGQRTPAAAVPGVHGSRGRHDLQGLRAALRSDLVPPAGGPDRCGGARAEGSAQVIRLPLVLIFSALLFSTGVYGVLARRNAVLVLMSIELMLNAVNVNLVAFSQWLKDQLITGQVFALFV